MVGVTGFEPAASWSRTKRSTKLSHTPVFNFRKGYYNTGKVVCQAQFTQKIEESGIPFEKTPPLLPEKRKGGVVFGGARDQLFLKGGKPSFEFPPSKLTAPAIIAIASVPKAARLTHLNFFPSESF